MTLRTKHMDMARRQRMIIALRDLNLEELTIHSSTKEPFDDVSSLPRTLTSLELFGGICPDHVSLPQLPLLRFLDIDAGDFNPTTLNQLCGTGFTKLESLRLGIFLGSNTLPSLALLPALNTLGNKKRSAYICDPVLPRLHTLSTLTSAHLTWYESIALNPDERLNLLLQIPPHPSLTAVDLQAQEGQFARPVDSFISSLPLLQSLTLTDVYLKSFACLIGLSQLHTLVIRQTPNQCYNHNPDGQDVQEEQLNYLTMLPNLTSLSWFALGQLCESIRLAIQVPSTRLPKLVACKTVKRHVETASCATPWH